MSKFINYDLISRCPLHWPEWLPRTPAGKRARSRFKDDRSVSQALDLLTHELEAVGARRSIISTNVALRRDGLPYSGQKTPGDPGAAVFFQAFDEDHAMACDCYVRVEHNLWAIAKTMKATRAIERWGAASLKQAFKGYQALPSPEECSIRPWHLVLGVSIDAHPEAVKRAYRKLLMKHHPDRGGDAAALLEVQRAYREAQEFHSQKAIVT